MTVSYEKLLKKAQMMRKDYEILSHSVSHPHVTIGKYQEIKLQVVEGFTTTILLYYPLIESNDSKGKLPVYVVFHSGAFARGSAYFDEYVNSVTANRVGCIVAAVEFQLAPEAQFPTQIEECYGVVKWINENAEILGADADKIAIGGHNSGGTIAADVELLIRDRGEFNICCAVLDCAMYTLYSDMDELPDFDMDDPLKGPIRGVFFNTCYLGDLKLGFTNHLASPLLTDSLQGLAPTLIVVAGKDAARPDAQKYYERLIEAGNDCRIKLYEGLPHGFNVQPGLATQDIVDASFEYLDSYLAEYFEK